MEGIVYERLAYASVLERSHMMPRCFKEVYLPEIGLAVNLEMGVTVYERESPLGDMHEKVIGTLEVDDSHVELLKDYFEENNRVEKIVEDYFDQSEKSFTPLPERKIRVTELEEWEKKLREQTDPRNRFPNFEGLPEKQREKRLKEWGEYWNLITPVIERDLENISGAYRNEGALKKKLGELNDQMEREGPFDESAGLDRKAFFYTTYGNKITMDTYGKLLTRKPMPIAEIDYAHESREKRMAR